MNFQELLPGSLIYFQEEPSIVCMTDIIEECLLIGLSDDGHKVIQKEQANLLQPIPLTAEMMRQFTRFDEMMTAMTIGTTRYYLSVAKGYAELLSNALFTVLEYKHVQGMHQLQQLYMAMCGKAMPVRFEHFVQEF